MSWLLKIIMWKHMKTIMYKSLPELTFSSTFVNWSLFRIRAVSMNRMPASLLNVHSDSLTLNATGGGCLGRRLSRSLTPCCLQHLSSVSSTNLFPKIYFITHFFLPILDYLWMNLTLWIFLRWHLNSWTSLSVFSPSHQLWFY